MKIIIELEDGEKPVSGYPAVLDHVNEFIVVGTRSGPLSERLEFKHVRIMGDTIGLRSLAFGVLELLRDKVTRDVMAQESHGVIEFLRKALVRKCDGGDGTK